MSKFNLSKFLSFKCIQKILKNVDQFGVSYQPYISRRRRIYKSTFSGTLTVVINLLTFIYFFYLMDRWIGNEIQPKVQEKSILNSDSVDFFYKISPVTVELFVQNNSFFEGKRIYDIIVTNYLEQEFLAYEQKENIPCMSKTLGGLPGASCLDVTKMDPTIFQELSYTNKIIMYFNKCNSSKYNNCISDEDLQTALHMKGSIWFQITQWIQQYDYLTDQIETIPQIQYFPFSTNQTQYLAQDVNLAEVNIDDGILLENNKKVKYMKDYKNYDAQYDISHTKYNFQDVQCYLYIQLGLNSQFSQIGIQNIKISEIMAQVSSIFQILMIFKFLCSFYNEQKLFYKISLKILKIQSPDRNDIFIQTFVQKILNIFKIQCRSVDDTKKEINQRLFVLNHQNIFFQFEQIHQIQKKINVYSAQVIKEIESPRQQLVDDIIDRQINEERPINESSRNSQLLNQNFKVSKNLFQMNR